jgi:hypothetical protein
MIGVAWTALNAAIWSAREPGQGETVVAESTTQVHDEPVGAGSR